MLVKIQTLALCTLCVTAGYILASMRYDRSREPFFFIDWQPSGNKWIPHHVSGPRPVDGILLPENILKLFELEKAFQRSAWNSPEELGDYLKSVTKIEEIPESGLTKVTIKSLEDGDAVLVWRVAEIYLDRHMEGRVKYLSDRLVDVFREVMSLAASTPDMVKPVVVESAIRSHCLDVRSEAMLLPPVPFDYLE